MEPRVPGSTARHREESVRAKPAVDPERRREARRPRGARVQCHLERRRFSPAVAARQANGASGRGYAGGDAAGMTGCDPSAVDSLLERLRNVRESNLQGSERCDGRLVSELADRAVLVGCVLLVADGRGGCGTGQNQRHGDAPGAPARAASGEPCVHGSSLDHRFSTLAEIARGGKASREGLLNPLQRRSARAGALDSGRVCLFNRRDGAVKAGRGNGCGTALGARARAGGRRSPRARRRRAGRSRGLRRLSLQAPVGDRHRRHARVVRARSRRARRRFRPPGRRTRHSPRHPSHARPAHVASASHSPATSRTRTNRRLQGSTPART